MSASEIAAWWGAAVATLVLGWDIFKWRQKGPQLRLTVSPGMKIYGDVPNAEPDKLYVLIEVVNVGDKKTEITNVVGLYYKSLLQRILGKNEKSFVVVNPAFSTEFPCFLEPSERWMGGIEQSEELEELSRKSLLYCGIFHSANKKALAKRVVINAKNT